MESRIARDSSRGDSQRFRRDSASEAARSRSRRSTAAGGGGLLGDDPWAHQRLAVNRDWVGEEPDAQAEEQLDQDVHNMAQGAFSMLARVGHLAAQGAPDTPAAKWRRSAIRMVAGSSARRAREATRLRALQRTPYPLVLARIKLLLDRLGIFKDQINAMVGGGDGSRGLGGAGARSRAVHAHLAATLGRSTTRVVRSPLPWGEDPEGAAAGEDAALADAIRHMDLSRAGGKSPSGPMEVLMRKASKVAREHGAGVGGSEGPGATAAGGRRSDDAASAGGLPSDELHDAAVAAAAGGMELEEGGTRMSLDKLLEELSTTFAYVSDFLRKVPEETRMEACFSARMENYKKDQTVYRIGEQPERFHLILTGTVEIWAHPPGNRREKTVVATLKKGQSFGEMAILNDEPRAEVATPTSNCTFLTFHRSDLLSIFGAYFHEQLLEAEAFFHNTVSVFTAMPKNLTHQAISHMLQSTYPAGKDWEPMNDQQIYFVKSGTASLEALDRRFTGGHAATAAAGGTSSGGTTSGAATTSSGGAATSSGTTSLAATRGVNAAAASAAAGGAAALDLPDADGNEVLQAISIVDGRAVGTLGHEEELRRLRRALIPKKTVATLEPGAHFGGGARILGEGELQSCIKITAITDMVLYHMHVDQFFKCAAPELIRAIRDDTAFKLTYYFGRQGTIGQDTVVGHSEASLVLKGALQEEESTAPARMSGTNMPRKKKGPVRKGLAGGGTMSAEVAKVVSYMAELQAELDSPGAKPLDLYKQGTPAERFHRNSALSGTARGNALPRLIAGVYGEGLAPLADKVECLAAKAARRLDSAGDHRGVGRMLSIIAPGGSPGASGSPSPTGGPGSPSFRPYSPSGAAAAAPSSPAGARLSSRLAAATAAMGVPGGRFAGLDSPSGAVPGSAGVAGPGAGGDGGYPGARPWSPVTGDTGGGRPRSSSYASPFGAAPGGQAAGEAGHREAWGGDEAAAAAAATSSPHGAVRHSSPYGVGPHPHARSPHGGGGGSASPSRTGALAAAGYIWQRMRDAKGNAPPAVRQCLTYDEIAHRKADAARASSGSPSSPGGGGVGTGAGGITRSGASCTFGGLGSLVLPGY